jgi:predicted nucleic acid-binding OB-fold protein
MMPENREPQRKFEEFAYVLENLEYGHPKDTRPLYRREPVVQAVGGDFFTLLELIPVPGVPIQPSERIAIGKWGREKIDHVKRRIDYEDLTQNAKDELQIVVEELVSKNEGRFVSSSTTLGRSLQGCTRLSYYRASVRRLCGRYWRRGRRGPSQVLRIYRIGHT